MADYKITVDSSDIAKGIAEAQKLERAVDKMHKAFAQGNINAEQRARGIEQLARSHSELAEEIRKYSTELAKTGLERQKAQAVAALTKEKERLTKAYNPALQAEKEYQKAKEDIARALELEVISQQEATIALAEAAIARNKYTQSYVREGDLARQQAIETKKLAEEKQKLARVYNPLLAATTKYKASIEEVNRAVQLGVINDTQAGIAKAQLTRDYNTATKSLQNYNIAIQRSTRGVNTFGLMTQQAGYQIGDFIVQVQSGTNAWVAAGQQLTQIAGTLTLLQGKWILIGTALGITIPLITAIGAAWARTRKEAEDTTEEFERLSSLLNTIEQIDLRNIGQDLLFYARNVHSEFDNILRIVRELKIDELKNRTAQLISPLTDELTAFEERQKKIQTARETRDRVTPGGFVGGTPDLGFNELLGLTNYQDAAKAAEILKTIGGDTVESYLKSVEAASELLEQNQLLTQEIEEILGPLAEEAGLMGFMSEESRKRKELQDDINKGLAKQRDLFFAQVEKAYERLKFYKEEEDSLQNQARLNQIALDYGKDSLQYEQEKRRQARDAYEAKLKEKNLYPSMINALMIMYTYTEGLVPLRDKATEAIEEANRAAENSSRLQRISNEFGKDSIQYLLAQQSIQREKLELDIKANNYTSTYADKLRESLQYIQALSRADFYSNIDSAASSAGNLNSGLGESVALATSLVSILGQVPAAIAGMAGKVDASIAALKAQKENLQIQLDRNVSAQAATIIQMGNRESTRAIQSGATPDQAASVYQAFVAKADEANADQEDIDRLNEDIRTRNKPPSSGGGSGGGGGGSAQADFIQKMQLEMDKRRELLKVYGAQRRLQEEVGRIEAGLAEDRNKYTDQQIENIARENLALQDREETYKRMRENEQRFADTIKDSMSESINSLVEGTKTLEEAFRDMTLSILRDLWDIIVTQQIVGSFNATTGQSSGVTGLIMNGIGALFRESGGSFQQGQPMVVGERGPELIVPKHSGTVVNNNVAKSSFSGGDNIYITNSITVSGNGSQEIRSVVERMIPQMAEAAKASVLDARRRGGTMKRTFA